MIPKIIQPEHVLKALAYIDKYLVPPGREAKIWVLLHNGNYYPVKYVIERANVYTLNRKIFSNKKFDSGDARNYLRDKLGFTVVRINDCIDNYVRRKNNDASKEIDDALAALSAKPRDMQKIIIETTIRNDTPIIKKLKKKYNYKCQYPGCSSFVMKANGENYVEVAHIQSVSTGGKSIVGNLIVLCPNHHKEFDLGNRHISKQSADVLEGTLNGKTFSIKF